MSLLTFVSDSNRNLLKKAFSLKLPRLDHRCTNKEANDYLFQFFDEKHIDPIHECIDAAEKGNFKKIKALIKFGIIDKETCCWGIKINVFLVILHFAIMNSDLKIIKYLVEHENFDIAEEDLQYAISTLHLALIKGDCEIVRYLLEHGSGDQELIDEDCWSIDCLEFLTKKYGIKIKDIRTNDTTFHIAIRYYNPEIIKLLLEQDFDKFSNGINCEDMDAVLLAINYGYTDLAENLIIREKFIEKTLEAAYRTSANLDLFFRFLRKYMTEDEISSIDVKNDSEKATLVVDRVSEKIDRRVVCKAITRTIVV